MNTHTLSKILDTLEAKVQGCNEQGKSSKLTSLLNALSASVAIEYCACGLLGELREGIVKGEITDAKEAKEYFSNPSFIEAITSLEETEALYMKGKLSLEEAIKKIEVVVKNG